jgi:hypothetical protein
MIYSRNQLCPCGSNKKYKRCCENTISLMNEVSFRNNIVGDIDTRKFNPGKQKIWRKSVKNLPQKIKKTISDYLRKEMIVEYGCYYNSSHLTLIEPEIKTIHGWYGYKISNKSLNNMGISNSNKRFVTRRDVKGIQIIDKKNLVIYDPHSWNEYKGIYFDLTTENNYKFDSWIEYVLTDVKDYKDIITNEQVRSYYIKEIMECKNYGLSIGRRILNGGIIGLLTN